MLETPDLERALVNSAAVFRSLRERENYLYLTAVCKPEPLTRRAWDRCLFPLASEEDMPEGHETPQLY